MFGGFFGYKIGMTQSFGEDRRVTPTTVIRFGSWYVTQVKTVEKDGYQAIQVSAPRKRYENIEFSADWLKSKSKYFLHVKELKFNGESLPEIGHKLTFDDFDLAVGNVVKVSGMGKGLGFQGVMRRWGFSGGPKSHGSTFHRAPGSVGNLVFGGEIVKGKKMPGRTGGKKITTTGLRIVSVREESGHLVVVGAVPGKKGGLLKVCRK